VEKRLKERERWLGHSSAENRTEVQSKLQKVLFVFSYLKFSLPALCFQLGCLMDSPV